MKLKKLLSVLLATTLLLTCMPLDAVPVLAEEFVPEQAMPIVGDGDYLYYSDLFYAYPQYLVNDAFSSKAQSVYNSVYQSYIDSPLLLGTGLEHALSTITSITDFSALITDALGVTNWSVNDALDSANEEFVYKLLSSSLSATGEQYDVQEKNCSKFKKAISTFNKFSEELMSGVTYSAEELVQMAFTELVGRGAFNRISASMVSQLWSEISNADFNLKDCFTLAETEFEIAQAIVYSLLLEDSRLSIVDDVLATQSENTILKRGMTRLKNKMNTNFAVRFCQDFVQNTVADQIFGIMDDVVETAFGLEKLNAICKLLNFALNTVADIPKFAEVLKWQTLICYSRDLTNGIKNVANRFCQGPALSNAIFTYESLFNAYDAIDTATLEITKKILVMEDPFAEAYMVLVEARNNGEDMVTIKSGTVKVTISSQTSSEDFYDMMRLGVLTNIATAEIVNLHPNISVYNSKTSVTLPRKANVFLSIVKTGISDEYLQAGELTVGNSYARHIASVKSAILSTPKEERITIDRETGWVYTFDGSTGVRHASDILESDCYYAVDGVICGDVYISGNLDAPTDEMLYIDGYLEVKWDSDVNINGLLSVQGSIYVAMKCSVNINGSLSVLGSMYIDLRSSANINGSLCVQGKLTMGNVVNVYGTLIVDSLLHKSVDSLLRVYNTLKVTGNFSLCTGSQFYVENSGEALVGGSVYGEGGSGYVENNGKLHVKGNLNPLYVCSNLTNNGLLIVDGELSYNDACLVINNGIMRIHNLDLKYCHQESVFSENSVIYVSGWYNGWLGSLPSIKEIRLKGTIIFDGDDEQRVEHLWADTVIIKNQSEKGVVFPNAVKIDTLLDHQGNNVAITYTGNYHTVSIPDYDGDGMRDDVDPQPTVGNPCSLYFQSEDVEKGFVSVESVKTIGGTKVSVEAIPTAKYEFTQWVNASGAVVSTSAILEVVAKGDTIYTAVFRKRSQPISVQVENGVITVPTKADIESTVTVTVTENDGYVYEEGSLSYNGIPVVDNAFVVPDEPVVLTATFVRNEHYFALAEVIATAKSYDAGLYTAETYEVLANAISVAEGSLYNRITEEESQERITLLQQAITGLKMNVLSGGLTSISEDVNGLAFKFDVAANGGQVENKTEYVPGSAQVILGVDGQGYKLVRMGAIVSNQSYAMLDASRVDGKSVIDIAAVYLCALDEYTLSFAARIINIPDTGKDTVVYARPYYVYEKDGEEIVVYGDTVSQTYNNALNA